MKLSINRFHFILIIFFTFQLTGCNPVSKNAFQTEGQPNIVFIFADDLGYGDISCFGANDIYTPNIDKIADNGIKFTEFYSASPLCSPSRAGLLTGRLPQRMGINDVFYPESFTGMASEEITIAEILKEKNYATCIVGKWHLGHHYQYLPLQQGFDNYFGIPYSNDMESVVYMRGNKVEEFEVNQQYITKRYTDEALLFIEQNQNKPFFLYLAHNMPHVPIYATDSFLGTSKRGLYGDVVQELDWSVGQVFQKLEDLHILENTLIVFSSDNGPWLAMKGLGGSAGKLREGKNYTFEGGMRVPTVAMWEKKIPKGTVNENFATQVDWFPTFAKIAGIELPMDRVFDGFDISNMLFNNGDRMDSTYLFFNRKELEAFRKGNMKIKKPYWGNKESLWQHKVAAHDTFLFDLKNDPEEKYNLFPEKKSITRNLFEEMNNKREEMGDLPKSVVVKTNADDSHFKKLSKNK